MGRRQRIDLSIGKVRIAIESGDDGPRISATGASRRFVTEVSSSPDLTVRARWGEPSSPTYGTAVFDSGGVWTLHEEDDWRVYRLTSPSFGPLPYKEARMSRDLTSGEIILRRDVFGSAARIYPLEYPLDEILVTHRLAFEGSVELHGCGLVDPGGRGLLFLGQSGAGKTTTARLWLRETSAVVLSDDRIIVREDGDGFRMWGTPWHGEEELAEPRSARLDRIYLLRQAGENVLESLPSASAVARLLSCAFPPFHDREAMDRTVATLERIVRGVPCVDFGFTPDAAAVTFVVDRL